MINQNRTSSSNSNKFKCSIIVALIIIDILGIILFHEILIKEYKIAIQISIVLIEIHLYTVLHELGHLIVYWYNNIDVCYAYIIPIEMKYIDNAIRYSFRINIACLGLVIPIVPPLREKSYCRFRKILSDALAGGPMVNLIMLLVNLLNARNGFLFQAGIYINIFMLIMAFGRNEMVLGDMYAHRYIKEKDHYYDLILYTYCDISQNQYKDANQYFLVKRLENCLKDLKYNTDALKVFAVLVNEELKSDKSILGQVTQNRIVELHEKLVCKYEDKTLTEMEKMLAERLMLLLIKRNEKVKEDNEKACLKD